MKTTERAKEIRKALKVNFPGVKFSVRSKSYSMGSSITISWTDFPTVDAVETIANKYESVRYDEYTGEILSGGNTYIDYNNTWSDDMKESIKENIVNSYGEKFYNEQKENWNLRRYEVSAFENLYNTTLEVKSYKKEIANINTEDIKVVLNDDKNGVEIYFNNKPSEEIRTQLKSNGFRWSKYNKCWYAKQSEDTLYFANSLTVKNVELDPTLLNETFETEENTLSNEEIESIIKNTEEYTNKVLKEELQELEYQDNYKIVETNVNIFLNDISIARKPSSIEDIKEFSDPENIVISKYLVLSNKMFNSLCNDFFMDFSPISKQGGTRGFINGIEVNYDNYNTIYEFYEDKSIMKYSDNILITNEDNTKYIVVNPEGYTYCRYVGMLTVSEGRKILKQLKGETKVNNLNIIKTEQNDTDDKTNYDIIVDIQKDIEALENRLKLVKSAKLKYKIELEINNKMKSIAKIIIDDPILCAQFTKEE